MRSYPSILPGVILCAEGVSNFLGQVTSRLELARSIVAAVRSVKKK